MATIENVRRLQEEIAAGMLAGAPENAATVFLRFEFENLGPGTCHKMLWYLDAAGEEHSPFRYGTREVLRRVTDASVELNEIMALLALDPASGRRHWKVYMLTIDAGTGHYRFEFEYQDELRWDPRPSGRPKPVDPLTGESLLRDRG